MNGFYWIYLVMIGFLMWYHFAKDREQRRLVYYGAWGFLILIFVAQDFSVSIDIAEYMRQYDVIAGLTFGEMLVHKFEIGYVLMCRLIETVFESDRVLLLALSLLILLPFARSYEEETTNPMVALMAFVALGMYMHAIIFWRQLVAMALLTYSYRYIRERRLLPFLAVLIAAMTFHKASVVFLGVYIVYNIPINKWLLLACVGVSAVLAFFNDEIIALGISVIYPQYETFPRLSIGGETLLALLWVVALLSYWVFRDRLNEGRIRLPFLMILIGATIQPICFAFYNWLRIVLFFRVALAAMTAELYTELFTHPNNTVMTLLARRAPNLHAGALRLYEKKWFQPAAQLLLFAFLFVWYASELDGARYVMAPIV